MIQKNTIFLTLIVLTFNSHHTLSNAQTMKNLEALNHMRLKHEEEKKTLQVLPCMDASFYTPQKVSALCFCAAKIQQDPLYQQRIVQHFTQQYSAEELHLLRTVPLCNAHPLVANIHHTILQPLAREALRRKTESFLNNVLLKK